MSSMKGAPRLVSMRESMTSGRQDNGRMPDIISTASQVNWMPTPMASAERIE